MARDDGSKAKKQKWADWINARLAERDWNVVDLVAASGDELVYGTVYNWTKAGARVEAETTLVVAAALGVPPSEALEAASYPLFADAMAGRELRLPGMKDNTPDPGIQMILAQSDLPDEEKARWIRWWRERLEDDNRRRIADIQSFLGTQERDSA